MDENFSRGYCQLMSDTPQVEVRSAPGSRVGAPPRDNCSIIYIALVLCGAGFLLPYNSFITAVDYYQAKYPGTTIIFDMSLTYICFAFLGVIINNIIVEFTSLQTRITFGYIISFVMLLLVAILDISCDIFTRKVSYYVNLHAVAAVALGCTIQQSSFYGYTSMLPQRYTQAVMTGESAAGLIVSINRVLTKAMLKDKHTNTIIFFSLSLVMIFLCCIVFHLTRRTQFVRFFLTLCEDAAMADDQRGITPHMASNPEVDILDGNVTRDTYGVLVIQSPTSPSEDKIFGNSVANENASFAPSMSQGPRDLELKGKSYKRHLPLSELIRRGCRSRYLAARKVWPYMVSIGLAYFVTLCLFPGIESEVVSCRLDSWMPVILISIFNLFDFIGKILGAIRYDWPCGRLVLLTFCRIILVPLLMLCAAPRDEPFLKGELWPMMLSLLLGLSNGYFGSVPMIIASTKVPDEQKELTGNIMTLSYSMGLTVGSVVAYGLNAFLGPHLSNDVCHPVHNVTIIDNSTYLPFTDTMTIGPSFH